jgi:uncharacterized cupin superfamily protein
MLLKNKKGYAMNLLDRWVDICAFALLAIGFFITLVAGSKILSVVVVFIAGGIVGRSIYMHNHKLQMRFWYMITGFIIGLVVGSRFLTYKGVIVTFVIGAFVGHYIRKKRILD